MSNRKSSKSQAFSLFLMIALYLFSGINHFISSEFYRKIMPSWLPFHHELVVISGFFEILFALLLIPVGTRPWAAWCIIALLVAVFPANIQMSVNYYRENNTYFWLTIFRLLLQPLLIFWAYQFTRRPKR